MDKRQRQQSSSPSRDEKWGVAHIFSSANNTITPVLPKAKASATRPTITHQALMRSVRRPTCTALEPVSDSWVRHSVIRAVLAAVVMSSSSFAGGPVRAFRIVAWVLSSAFDFGTG